MDETFPSHEINHAAQSVVGLSKTSQEQVAATTNWDNAFSLIENFHLSKEPENRAAVLREWRTEDYMAAVAAMHSVLANDVSTAPAENPVKIVSPSGEVQKVLAPSEERLAIYTKGVELIKQLYDISAQEEARSLLDRISDIVALCIVLEHSFEDGNGRTARVMAHIIRNGYDGSDKSKGDIQLLGSNRPSKGFKVNSYVPRGEFAHEEPDTILEAAAALGTPLALEDQYKAHSWTVFSSPSLEFIRR